MSSNLIIGKSVALINNTQQIESFMSLLGTAITHCQFWEENK